VVEVAVQLFVLGSYLPPLLKTSELKPPQTIISLPVHTAVCEYRAAGALVTSVLVQLSAAGSYRPPSLKTPGPYPPQIIISLPV
jgi:hypothetical protein